MNTTDTGFVPFWILGLAEPFDAVKLEAVGAYTGFVPTVDAVTLDEILRTIAEDGSGDVTWTRSGRIVHLVAHGRRVTLSPWKDGTYNLGGLGWIVSDSPFID